MRELYPELRVINPMQCWAKHYMREKLTISMIWQIIYQYFAVTIIPVRPDATTYCLAVGLTNHLGS